MSFRVVAREPARPSSVDYWCKQHHNYTEDGAPCSRPGHLSVPMMLLDGHYVESLWDARILCDTDESGDLTFTEQKLDAPGDDGHQHVPSPAWRDRRRR